MSQSFVAGTDFQVHIFSSVYSFTTTQPLSVYFDIPFSPHENRISSWLFSERELSFSFSLDISYTLYKKMRSVARTVVRLNSKKTQNKILCVDTASTHKNQAKKLASRKQKAKI